MRSNRKERFPFSGRVYRQQNLVERFFNRIKHFRGVATVAQGAQLDVFWLLVRHEPHGSAAGEIACQLYVPQNTISAHLAVLSRAGLVRSERQSRKIIHRADLDGLRVLTLFLFKDCYAGSPDPCAPLVAELTPCC